jgi:hypothetical protein
MFSHYSGKENATTNNVLLLLKTIYAGNVFVFNRIISEILGKESDFGVSFAQQTGFFTQEKGKGVADGKITQEPVTLLIETKTTDWFYSSQLERYMEFLSGITGTRALILLSDFRDGKKRCEDKVVAKLNGKEDPSVSIALIGFNEFIRIVKEEAGGSVPGMIEDFEDYLNNAGLLSDWENVLDIIPCQPDTLSQNKAYAVYACPNTGGPYYHKRAKYMGFYHAKKIDDIAVIDAVVDIKSADQACWEIKYMNNEDKGEKEIKKQAQGVLDHADFYGNKDLSEGRGILLFLLRDFREKVNYQKTSPGGIMGRIFKSFKGLKDLEDLQNQIKDKTWE